MRLTPAEDVVAILRTSVRVLAVGMDGVSDDDVEVEGSVEEPLEGGEEEVVKTHGERVAQQLQADEAHAALLSPDHQLPHSFPFYEYCFWKYMSMSCLNTGILFTKVDAHWNHAAMCS